MKLILTLITSSLLFCPKSQVNVRINMLNSHLPKSLTDSDLNKSDLNKSASKKNSHMNFSSDVPSHKRYTARINSPDRGCFHFVLAPLRYIKNKF